MNLNRRTFIGTVANVGAVSLLYPTIAAEKAGITRDVLEAEASRPVLRKGLFSAPVKIESMQLLKKGRSYFLRVRSTDGVEGLSVDNSRADVLHPVLNKLVIPYFIGKDARDLEDHLWGVYRQGDNYKLQGLLFWCAIALVEFAVL